MRISSVLFQEKQIECGDGFVLKARLFVPEKVTKHKIIMINSATGVSQRFYKNYASFMAANGYHVVTYDYRGIAASRPKKLKGFQASFTTWGNEDLSSVLSFVSLNFPDFPILVLGHSIGGTLIGMTPKANMIKAALNIGAQTAYYKDWAKGRRQLYFLWHMLFPVMTYFVGYFPGRKLGLLEDIPKGVVKQWHARRKNPDMINQLDSNGVTTYFNQFRGRLLTLAIADDPIGTETAIRRIYRLFENANKSWETVRPSDISVSEIGHFGFFRKKFKETLWAKTLTWFDEV